MGNDWPRNDEGAPRETTIITVERASGEVVEKLPFKGNTEKIKRKIKELQGKAGAEYDVLEKLAD